MATYCCSPRTIRLRRSGLTAIPATPSPVQRTSPARRQCRNFRLDRVSHGRRRRRGLIWSAPPPPSSVIWSRVRPSLRRQRWEDSRPASAGRPVTLRGSERSSPWSSQRPWGLSVSCRVTDRTPPTRLHSSPLGRDHPGAPDVLWSNLFDGDHRRLRADRGGCSHGCRVAIDSAPAAVLGRHFHWACWPSGHASRSRWRASDRRLASTTTVRRLPTAH